MKIKVVFSIIAVSFVMTLVGRLIQIEVATFQENRQTENLCNAVGNYLEVGNLRESYEGLQAGLARSGHHSACVSVTDNGRSYAPECAKPSLSYRTTVCRAEANKGVQAQVMYPTIAIIGQEFLYLWIFTILGLSTLYFLFSYVAKQFAWHISNDLQNRLFKQKNSAPGNFTEQCIEWLLVKSGIKQIVQAQSTNFENTLKLYEQNARDESALRARQEAENTKSKEYLEKVKQIRHDIRSPLSTLHAIKEEITADSEVTAALSTSIRGIEKLVEELDVTALTSADNPKLTIAEVHIEETLNSLRLKFQKAKQVKMTLSYSKQKLSPLFVSPISFSRVIENLLENAFDAVSIGGAVNIAITSDESTCRIEIEDNGCGISPEILPKIFSKGATFGKANGGGLGLHHAKKCIESWRGDIVCESVERGARFIITLPLVQTGVVYAGFPQTIQLAVVDDDPFIHQNLKNSGFDVVSSALNYAAGKALLASQTTQDVPILVDQNLGQNKLGTDLIAENSYRRDIYLCTNDFDDLDVVRRAKAVGVRVIPKPLCIRAEPVPFTAATTS